MHTHVRVAREADASASCEVLRRSITECCAKDHNNERSLIEPWLANKTPDNVRQWITSPKTYAVVAETAGVIVGVAMMTMEGEITLCYLVPEARFNGIGKALLAELESEARVIGLGELRLSSTRTAHQFYQRNGFESLGPPSASHGVACIPMAKSIALARSS